MVALRERYDFYKSLTGRIENILTPRKDSCFYDKIGSLLCAMSLNLNSAKIFNMAAEDLQIYLEVISKDDEFCFQETRLKADLRSKSSNSIHLDIQKAHRDSLSQ